MGEVIIIKAEDPDNRLYNHIFSFLSDNPFGTVDIKRVPSGEDISAHIQIDKQQYKAFRDGKEIPLSKREFNLLCYLAMRPGQVLSKNQIYEAVYNEVVTEGLDNMIYCLVSSLRRKLEPNPKSPKYIHTISGIGYKFQPLSEE